MAWKISRRESGRGSRPGITSLSCAAANALRNGASAERASASGANISQSKRALTTRLLGAAGMGLRAPLMGHVIDVLQHLIRRLHDLRVGLIGPLRDDHLDKLIHHVNVGVFQYALLQSAQTFRPARSTHNGITRGGGGGKEIVAIAQ